MDKLLVLPKTGRIFAGTHKIQIDLMQRMKKVARIPAVNWCLITSNHAKHGGALLGISSLISSLLICKQLSQPASRKFKVLKLFFQITNREIVIWYGHDKTDLQMNKSFVTNFFSLQLAM